MLGKDFSPPLMRAADFSDKRKWPYVCLVFKHISSFVPRLLVHYNMQRINVQGLTKDVFTATLPAAGQLCKLWRLMFKYLVQIWAERIIRLHFISSLILCYYTQIGHDHLILCHFLLSVHNRPHKSRHITWVVDLTSGKMFRIASVNERCILNSNPSLYRMHLLSCPWTRQLSLHVPVDAGFLWHRAAMLRYTM